MAMFAANGEDFCGQPLSVVLAKPAERKERKTPDAAATAYPGYPQFYGWPGQDMNYFGYEHYEQAQ